MCVEAMEVQRLWKYKEAMEVQRRERSTLPRSVEPRNTLHRS